MGDRLDIHPVTPQARLMQQAARSVLAGGLLVVPTDAGYSLVWSIDAIDAENRVQRLRALDSRHPFTVLCASISQIGSLAKLDDRGFRIVKSLTPGPSPSSFPQAQSCHGG